ncbi:MAG: ABC transporter ATP-binding protein [Candidatus Heimdallarchaeota archaeon]
MKSAVELDSLSKTYFSRWMRFQIRALQDISLQILPETLTIFHGPNGSGKSTILKILATLTRPTSGKAFIFGVNVARNPRQVRVLTGFLPENLFPPSDVTASEYLKLLGRLRNVTDNLSIRVDELLQKVRLLRWRDVPVQLFSSGMQQRLGFAQAMVSDPDLYLLDEPLSSLDASGRDLVLEELQILREKGKTIIISTHRDEFLRNIADNFVLLENGRLVENKCIARGQ